MSELVLSSLPAKVAVAVERGETNPHVWVVDGQLPLAHDAVPDFFAPRIPPTVFARLDQPCPTCKGHGQRCESGRFCSDPDCHDGHLVFNIVKPCPKCDGDTGYVIPEHKMWLCHDCQASGSASVARATLRVLPVVRFIQQAPRPVLMGWHWVPDTYYARVFEKDGTQEWWVHTDDGESLPQRDLHLDPLPSPGQYVAMLTVLQ